jgi:hypothetical protein
MNEFALANFFFVLAGFLTFLIESFSPSKEEMARKIAEEEKFHQMKLGIKQKVK